MCHRYDVAALVRAFVDPASGAIKEHFDTLAAVTGKTWISNPLRERIRRLAGYCGNRPPCPIAVINVPKVRIFVAIKRKRFRSLSCSDARAHELQSLGVIRQLQPLHGSFCFSFQRFVGGKRRISVRSGGRLADQFEAKGDWSSLRYAGQACCNTDQSD